MPSIRILLALLFILPLLATGACAGKPLPLDQVNARLKKDFPRLPANDVQPTPVEGMFAVISGLNIFYYFPESGHLLNGELYNKSLENLTQKASAELLEKVLADLPLDRAVKIGSGPVKVIEITDPDCPFCRKASAFFDDKDDQVTRYVFFFPLTQLHPNAAAKAAWILAADDGAAAYHAIMKGAYDKSPLPEHKDNGRLAEHQAIAEKLGVRGTPQFFLKGVHINGANIPELAKLLGGAAPQAVRPPQQPKPAAAK